jgi:ATP-binding cassette subfamily C protein
MRFSAPMIANDRQPLRPTGHNGPLNMTGAVRDHLALAIAFSAVLNILMLAPSIYMLQVYDRVLVSGGLLTLAFLSVVIVVCLVVIALLDSLRTRVMARAGLKLDKLLCARVMSANLQDRSRGPGGDVSGVRDLDNLRQGLTSPVFVALMDAPWTPLYIFVCFWIHPWVGALALGGAVLIMAIAMFNERASRDSLRRVSQVAPAFYGGLEADMRVAETTRALGMREAVVLRRVRERSALLLAQVRSAFISSGFTASTKFVRMLLQSAALGLGGFLAVNQEITAGAIIAVTILTARAFGPVEQVVGGWRQLTQTRDSYFSLQKLLGSQADVRSQMALPSPKGRIDVVNIAAAPQGGMQPAIAGVTFTVMPGDVVGVVGPSGAGKSTLARVLANAVDPLGGEIRIDGARYSDWDPDRLAKHMGYLPQAVDLVAGTIAQNISRFAMYEGVNEDSIAEKVVSAAKAARVHELILRLPRAYDTMLGPGGRGLSAGQAQRVALARALYDDPVVIVMDEPNASVDQEGELALIEAVKSAKAKGATVFLVAHRAGVMSVADKLLVMRDGRLLEFGPRDQVAQRLAAAAGAQPSSAPAIAADGAAS